jgi:hypothetical protein
MTKYVRIENADTNVSKQIRLEYWEQGILKKTEYLAHPCVLSQITLWDGLEIRVTEIDAPVQNITKNASP